MASERFSATLSFRTQTLDIVPELEDPEERDAVLTREPWRSSLAVGSEVAIRKVSINEWFAGKVKSTHEGTIKVEFMMDRIPSVKTMLRTSSDLQPIDVLSQLQQAAAAGLPGVLQPPAQKRCHAPSPATQRLLRRARSITAESADANDEKAQVISGLMVATEGESEAEDEAGSTSVYNQKSIVTSTLSGDSLSITTASEDESETEAASTGREKTLKYANVAADFKGSIEIGSTLPVCCGRSDISVDSVVTDISPDGEVKVAYLLQGKLFARQACFNDNIWRVE